MNTVLRGVLAPGVAVVVSLGVASTAAAQEIVSPGAFCSVEGATAQTNTGVQMQCVTEGADQARWRESTGVPAPTVLAEQEVAPVDQAQPQGELAKTGAESTYLAIAAFVMILVGLKLTILSSDLAFRSRMRLVRSSPARYEGPGW